MLALLLTLQATAADGTLQADVGAFGPASVSDTRNLTVTQMIAKASYDEGVNVGSFADIAAIERPQHFGGVEARLGRNAVRVDLPDLAIASGMDTVVPLNCMGHNHSLHACHLQNLIQTGTVAIVGLVRVMPRPHGIRQW